jgi:hypothetical protein
MLTCVTDILPIDRIRAVAGRSLISTPPTVEWPRETGPARSGMGLD